MKYSFIFAAIATSFSATAIAEDPTSSNDSDQENTLVITASRSEQPLDSVLSAFDLISREEIELIQPTSMSDLLSKVAGLDVVRQGGGGQNASVFTRGANSNQTLILVDGVRVGSATLGVKSLQSIPTVQIERIEIIKGPRAAIWGSDAIGGVIHIITRKIDGTEASLEATSGSDGYNKQVATAGVSYDSGSTSLSISNEETDGYNITPTPTQEDDDGFERTSYSLRSNYRFSDNFSTDLVYQDTHGELEFDTAFGGADKSDYENEHWVINVLYRSGNWLNTFSYSESTDDSETTTSFFRTERDQNSWLTHYTSDSGLALTGGFDFYTDEVEASTNFSVSERDTEAGFLHLAYETGNWIFEAALRREEIDNIDSENTHNVGIGYRLNSNWTVIVNQGTGFKVPTFNDLYFPASNFSAGNPDLVSETSDNVELIIRGSYENARLEFVIYDNEVDDLIVWLPNDQFFFQPFNVAKATLSGFESTIDFDGFGLNHKFTYSYVDAEDDSTGSQLLRRADQVFNYNLSKTIGAFNYLLHMSYHGERPDAVFNNTTFTTDRVTLSDYVLVDTSFTYAFNKRLKIKGSINNLFDEDYQDVANFITPGTEFYLSLEYRTN